ncbi:Zn-ribbon domain-containing OB-fold protein [Microbacterium sp. A93]|uniref:Zn-ribbon domain-containing OB-fold protein n=1 Tax=Microbacterium sp. A93 TaxID=3450716 RepID=UPI003F424A44
MLSPSQSAEENVLRPIPLADDLTEPYWSAAREGRLVIQRCTNCGNYQHPPRIYCSSCQEGALEFSAVSGEATVYSYSKVVEANTPGLKPPYAVIFAELVEQAGLWILSDCPGDFEIRVGDPLELSFQEIREGVVLPQFRPVGYQTLQ